MLFTRQLNSASLYWNHMWSVFTAPWKRHSCETWNTTFNQEM